MYDEGAGGTMSAPLKCSIIKENHGKKYIFSFKKQLTHPTEYNIMYNCDIG